MNNVIQCKDVYTFSNPIKVIFNSKEFDFLSIHHFYKYDAKFLENSEYKEVLPGINFLQQPVTPKGLFKKLLYFVKEKEFDTDDANVVSFQLLIENKRDFIQVYRNLSADKYPKWDNSVPDEYELIYESGSETGSAGYYKVDRFTRLNLAENWDYQHDKEKRYIDTSRIPLYPGSLGSGTGCILESVFGRLKLIDYNQKEYSLFKLEEVLTETAKEKRFLDICKHFKHCNSLIQKMTNDTYDINYPDGEQIRATEYDGVYITHEGKHRTCIAKRFDVPKIYAVVTKGVPKQQQQQEKSVITIEKARHNNPRDIKKILDDCYSSFESIGFSQKETRELLRDGVSGLQLIERIEAKHGMDIYKLAANKG